MSALQPHVVPIFATPLGVVSVPGAESLNPLLGALLASRATAEQAEPGAAQPNVFRSRANLLEWSEEPARAICAALIEAVRAVARTINDFDDAQFASLRVQARAWYTIVRENGCVPSHAHANAAWCAIYCVAAPPVSTSRHDSGVVRLHESFRATMFADATTSVAQLPYRPGHNSWRPVPGQVVVFPASVIHEIALLRAPGQLVLVSLLARFLGPGQTGLPGW